MSTDKKKIEVSLLGQRFTVKTERNEEYVQMLARLVGHKLEEMRKQTRAVSTHHLAVLVALNLADQLYSTEEELKTIKTQLRDRAENALKQVSGALSHLSTIQGN